MIAMPISIEEFESTPGPELRKTGIDSANAERVLTFLREHADEAFSPAEIRVETAVPRGSVCVVLSRLEDRGLVRHRGHYWAVGTEVADDADDVIDDHDADDVIDDHDADLDAPLSD